MNVLVRDEEASDIAAISDVTIAAFKTLEISNQTEHLIVEELRKVDALSLSLVAEFEGKIVGHIAISKVSVSDGTESWFGLGPVSVLPEHQRKGIGKALIKVGLTRLEEIGGKGCCLVGHPKYYQQFGFRNAHGLGVEGVPQEVFFVLSFDGQIPQGSVTFHEAFRVRSQQAKRATEGTKAPPHPAGGSTTN